ncbi:hypothetical protein XK27_03245 [Streptococcus suis]|nr:hypothetical protein A7J10_09195 [Streptococcus suis]KPA68142.1 hypothetical protein XK27_03245 [Streptococcus suis]
MNQQDYSAFEIFIWNLTIHDPYSEESLARRFLASGVGAHNVAKILDMDVHYVDKLDRGNIELFLNFSERFSKAMKNIEILGEEKRAKNDQSEIFFRFRLPNDIGLSRVLGMSTAQFQIFNEQFLDYRD